MMDPVMIFRVSFARFTPTWGVMLGDAFLPWTMRGVHPRPGGVRDSRMTPLASSGGSPPPWWGQAL